jgi:hypothetical protein
MSSENPDYWTRTDALLAKIKVKIGTKNDTELAKFLRVSKGQISNYKNRRNRMGAVAIIRCWAALGDACASTILDQLAAHEEHRQHDRRAIGVRP